MKLVWRVMPHDHSPHKHEWWIIVPRNLNAVPTFWFKFTGRINGYKVK